MPMISVVMPVYNAEKYLKEAIESILIQNYTDFEFIIVTNGCTDNSPEIIRSYMNNDKRIVLIEREESGLVPSLNDGFDMASGRYIARMDADDISLPHRFERQIDILERTGADICGCHYFEINSKGRYSYAMIKPLSRQSFVICLSQTVPFAHGSVMIRREFLRRNSLRYGMNGIIYAEDYALWVNMFYNRAVLINPDEFLYKFRIVQSSYSNKMDFHYQKARFKISSGFIDRNMQELSAIDDVSELMHFERDYLLRTSLYMLIYKQDPLFFRIIRKMRGRDALFIILDYFFGFLKYRFYGSIKLLLNRHGK